MCAILGAQPSADATDAFAVGRSEV
jgi:hypothetical protein